MHPHFLEFLRDKRVLITGHTGFKGSWLSEWLLIAGAEVTGYSLAPTGPNPLFDQLALEGRLDHRVADVRDRDRLTGTVEEVQPDLVFHLAAQPLVRESYADPVSTYETNVLGAVYLLDALRRIEKRCAAVIVTTDKCYENDDRAGGYREDDDLGGHDPYSSSKACAEIAVSSWRRSFFGGEPQPVRVATARAGNVIGGGDWAADRIVPDCIRALDAGRPIVVRNRHSIRPWQHVLDPLFGYLTLARRLYSDEEISAEMDAFNFGPGEDSRKTVEELVTAILEHRPGEWVDQTDPKAPHEASCLTLSISKAARLLSWHPLWGFERAVRETVEWYREASDADPVEVQAITQRQILSYFQSARAGGPSDDPHSTVADLSNQHY